MGQENNKKKTGYQSLKRLGATHYEAMALRLTGSTIDEIAVAINKKPATVDNWFYRDETFRKEFEERRNKHIERAKDILEAAAPKAAERMLELIKEKGKNAKVALGAAKDILDRAGLKPVDKHEHRGEGGGPMILKVVVDDTDISSTEGATDGA